MREQAVEAERRRAVSEAAAMHLGERGLRAFGGRHGIALPRRVRGDFVREQKRLPGFGHMPLHVIGQHAEEDVGLDAGLQAMPDRAHLEIGALQRAEGTLHFGEPFVVQDSSFGAHLRFGGAGADHRPSSAASAATRASSTLKLNAPSWISRSKCLPTLYLPTALPTLIPILPAPASRPAATIAATFSSSRTVAAIRSLRFSARSLASSGLRHATSRSPG